MKYDYMLEIEKLTLKDINDIKNFKITNASSNLLVVINNTLDLTSDMLNDLMDVKNIKIQVKGPYNKEYVSKYNNLSYVREQNIYSIFELREIIRQMEAIEEVILNNLKPLPKVFMIYDYLRTNYDIDYFSKVNDLKGIILGDLNPLSLSIIFKEMLDRYKIPNEIIFSLDNSIAYNKVTISKYSYLFNLAEDTYSYQNNMYSKIKYFSNMDINTFLRRYSINKKENLASLTSVVKLDEDTMKILNKLTKRVSSNVNFRIYKRKDESRIMVGEMNKDYYMPKDLNRYFIADIYNNEEINNPKIFYTKDKLLEKDDEIADTLLSREKIDNLFKNNIYSLDEEKNEYVDNLKVKTYKKSSFDCLLLEKTYSSNVYFYNYYELYKNKKDDITFYQTEIITSNDLFKVKGEKLINEFLKTAKVSFRSYYLDGFMGYCSDSNKEN
ncbi:MAG: hypothetical protein HXK72_02620 [Clostridiales bacterium]|nr:hypothetical protein [Clostridiales bacterium]